jgi:serine/threonine protein kinase
MNSTVEQLCDKIAERRLISDADLTRLKARWFRPGRADVNDVDKFAQWLTVNGYLTAFAVHMLRSGKADLLRLNQYQLLDHLASGPFAGAYLAVDPLGRHVVLEVLGKDRAAKPEAVQAFQVAAEKARSVQHPNINLTLDFGEAHGRHYLVREYDEGETLAEILVRRGRMKPITAARLFALALVGLQALHEKQVAAGPLGADSILLSVGGKTASRKSRNVKILNAGVPRSQFDPSALDPATTAAPLSSGAGVSPAEPADPGEELFRLGVTFYRCLTGQLPFPAETTGATAPHAMPIRQLAPEVPEMLAQLVESMIDPQPLQRPRGAAQAAKSLRVLLASEEEAAAAQPEEELVPHPAAPAPVPVSEPEEPAHTSASSQAEEQPAPQGAVSQQFKKLWEELAPSQRDWVFLGIGAAAVVLLVLFLTLVTGIHFVNVVCLLTGGALSFLVERMLRLREGQPE